MPEFAQPAWLLLLLAVPLLWVLRFVISGVAESRVKRLLSTALRSLALAVLIVALAGPLTDSYSRHTDIVFVLDHSQSIAQATTQQALQFIERAWAMKEPAARMGLVVFGADAALEVLVRSDSKPINEISSHVERDGSNLGRALEVAVGAFPSGQQRRIVLLSDGQENLGKAHPIAVAARSIGIEIVTIPLQQQKQLSEVRVHNINLPDKVHAHEPFAVQMNLHSNQSSQANLVMLRNGSLIQQLDVTLEPGINTFSLVDQVEQGGLYEYEVIVNSENDASQENNRYQAFVRVKGSPRVLHVAASLDWAQPVTKALRTQNLRVEEIAATSLPATLHELTDYDLIILNNVSGFELSLARMELLEDYVKDSGGGLISLGGDQSYAAGGYYATPIERLLPVTMDLKSEVKIPSLVVILVLDKSGSMSSISQGEQKLAIAKRAAVAAIELLNSLDRVGILAFDAAFEWNIPPTEVANRRSIIDKLRTLEVGGGTNLYLALAEAHRVMQQQQARVKHLIVLSDGLTDTDADFAGLSQRIADDKITVSTIALGGDADRELMQLIAALGKGRFYYADNPQNIPRIFTSETLVVARDLVVEQLTQPILNYPGEMLAGFTENNPLPPLLGYQRTFAKPSAQILLNAPKHISTDPDPLLVSWRYGLGKTVAFTSDLSTRWGQQWISWPEFNRLIAQMTRWAMRRSGTETLIPTFNWQGKNGEIVIDALDKDERFINGLSLQASFTDTHRNAHTSTLKQIAPGRYRGEFPIAHSGRYYVNLSGLDANTNAQISPTTFGLAIPYSSEYLALGTNHKLLRELATTGNGQLLPLADSSLPTLVKSTAGKISERWRIWWPFFLAALLLLLLEIAVRKIDLPESWSARWQTLRNTQQANTANEPGYAELRSRITQVREQHLAALQNDSQDKSVYQLDNPATRARLYMASMRNKPSAPSKQQDQTT